MSRDQQLVPRLRRFFQENPGEILTFDDIATKFGVTRLQARGACGHLREEGLIVTEVVAMVIPERLQHASQAGNNASQAAERASAAGAPPDPVVLPEVAAETVVLTDRERQVLQLLASGIDSSKAIAERMGLTWYTVNDYVHDVFRKIGVRSRVAAAVWAVRNGVA